MKQRSGKCSNRSGGDLHSHEAETEFRLSGNPKEFGKDEFGRYSGRDAQGKAAGDVPGGGEEGIWRIRRRRGQEAAGEEASEAASGREARREAGCGCQRRLQTAQQCAPERGQSKFAVIRVWGFWVSGICSAGRAPYECGWGQ